jgi:hypothetical protein
VCGQPTTDVPLQSFENVIRGPSLLPGQGDTLMVLSRSSKFSNKQREPYLVRLNPFDVWVQINEEIHLVFEVLVACPMTTEAVILS